MRAVSHRSPRGVRAAGSNGNDHAQPIRRHDGADDTQGGFEVAPVRSIIWVERFDPGGVPAS